MNRPISNVLIVSAFLIVLTGCSQPNSGDPQEETAGTSDTDRFWVFPNPLKNPGTGVYETNAASYAQAYYATIDPTNARATLDGFKSVNQFGTTGAGIEEVSVVFRDARDLGYGRRLTVRHDTVAQTVAAFVENYQVVPFAENYYTSLNLEAAIVVNRRYHIGTNAIEYSGGVTKFYAYSPSGDGFLTVDLDGRGQKAMPSVCINCHGGRADPLVSVDIDPSGATNYQTRFPDNGNTKARMQPIEVDSVEFWSSAPYRRVDQEEAIRKINYTVFCTYPIPTPAGGVDSCRAAAGPNDWQGGAADLVKSWYQPSTIATVGATFSDSYVTGWDANATQLSLYQDVVAPYCRVCHQVSGTANNSFVDFSTYAKFESYADRIKKHVFERGNMPLGLLIYEGFWSSTAPTILANWLETVSTTYYSGAAPANLIPRDSNGVPVRPSGIRTDPTLLTGTAYRFERIKDILVSASASCVSCHDKASDPFVSTSGRIPPVYYGDSSNPSSSGVINDDDYYAYDRDNDGVINSTTDSLDDLEFYRAVRGRVNFTDPEASPLLRRPSYAGGHHKSGLISGFDIYGLSDNNRAYYDVFLEWVRNGAPYSDANPFPATP